MNFILNHFQLEHNSHLFTFILKPFDFVCIFPNSFLCANFIKQFDLSTNAFEMRLDLNKNNFIVVTD